MMGIAVCNEESFMPVRDRGDAVRQSRRARTIAISRSGDCAPPACGCASTRRRDWRSRAGSPPGPRSRGCCTRRCHDDPGHALWQRDFTGASGLFAIVLRQGTPKKAIDAMLDGMELFGMGASWGGFESLILPVHPERLRTAVPWLEGPVLRLHAGLEDRDDLIADLARGFARLNAS